VGDGGSAGSLRPRINEVEAEVREVAEVAGGEGRPTSRRDAGDLYVGDLEVDFERLGLANQTSTCFDNPTLL